MDLDKFKNDYDWTEAFLVSGADINTVTEIIKYYNGCNDAEPWIIVCKTNENKYMVLEAWCDYTGWDCQAGGTYEIYDTLGGALADLTPEQANRLEVKHDLNKLI